MRRIIFRGKVSKVDNRDSYMTGKWVEGLITFIGSFNGVLSAMISGDNKIHEYLVDINTIGQYTGL